MAGAAATEGARKIEGREAEAEAEGEAGEGDPVLGTTWGSNGEELSRVGSEELLGGFESPGRPVLLRLFLRP